MRTLQIAFCLIEQGDLWHLQLRDGDPKIGAAGLIGSFGGKIEENEDPLLAICRELREETSLAPLEDQLRFLGIVEVVSDHQLEPVKVVCHVYQLSLDPDMEITALEGQLTTIAKAEAHIHLHRMTPGTRACFEQYILKGLL